MENIPWRREWLPTPVFLPGVFHGLRSLVAYSPWGQKGSHMTATNTFTSFTCITTHSSTYPLNTCLFVCLPVYLSTYLPTYLSIPLYKHNEFLPIQFKSKVTRVLLVFLLWPRPRLPVRLQPCPLPALAPRSRPPALSIAVQGWGCILNFCFSFLNREDVSHLISSRVCV